MPVDVNDEVLFPELAEARRHIADMRVNDPERWAELQREWL
jgi:hypothetical protein